MNGITSIRVNLGAVSVFFELQKSGIYTLGQDGGTGKTYLYGLLKTAQDAGEGVLSVRCTPCCNILKLLQKKFTVQPNLVFIDRYDNSASIENNRVIGALSHSMPILLDYKTLRFKYALGVKKLNTVEITRYGGSIYVKDKIYI